MLKQKSWEIHYVVKGCSAVINNYIAKSYNEMNYIEVNSKIFKTHCVVIIWHFTIIYALEDTPLLNLYEGTAMEDALLLSTPSQLQVQRLYQM